MDFDFGAKKKKKKTVEAEAPKQAQAEAASGAQETPADVSFPHPLMTIINSYLGFQMKEIEGIEGIGQPCSLVQSVEGKGRVKREELNESGNTTSEYGKCQPWVHGGKD